MTLVPSLAARSKTEFQPSMSLTIFRAHPGEYSIRSPLVSAARAPISQAPEAPVQLEVTHR